MPASLFAAPDWVADSNIYEVNLRQYTPEGTFTAFAGSLPRLKDMGVEILWLMPIHPIGNINRKGSLGSYYSIADFKGINPEFGQARDLHLLIDEAHKLGMRVIMDWVANHAAWDNTWTKDHPEYFVRGEHGGFKAPYDWTDVIQIDHSNELQQAAMIDAMNYWVREFDIDGFRADLAHLTPLNFWKKARTAIDKSKPGLFWLAESEEISYHEAFDATFTWEWMHTTESFYKGNINLNGLYDVLNKYELSFPATAIRMYFTSNHDENTWNGTAVEKYGDMLKVLIVFSCTWNGIPMIYSGEEVLNPKRLLFFDKDPIDWNTGESMHEFYKILLGLRKTNKALRAGDMAVSTFHIITEGSKSVMAYLRKNEEDEVLVLLNLDKESTGFVIRDRMVDGIFREVFSGREVTMRFDVFVKMQGWEYLVFEKKK